MAFLKYGFKVKCVFLISAISGSFGICYLAWISIDSKLPVMRDRGIMNTTAREKLFQTCTDNCESRFANKDELHKLGAIVFRRLQFIQNPKSCQSRRKLHCLIHRGCGFGCQVNTISNCLMLGYALNRTTVVTPRLTKLLKSLSSTCHDVKGFNRTALTEGHENYQVVDFRLIGNKYKPDFYPPAVPEDLFKNIRRYHDNPFLWWTGQISSFVFRITESTYTSWIRDEFLKEFKEPIVGVHVRRTDKLRKDASLHTLDEYMVHVERWFKNRPGFQPKIFLATDDLRVIEEISEKYPKYKVLSNVNITMAAAVKQRKSEISTAGIIHDIYLLSKCDFVVCTFTSNVCRLVTQLITAERGNVSDSVVSVDHPVWHFSGQRKYEQGNRNMASAKMPNYPDNL